MQRCALLLPPSHFSSCQVTVSPAPATMVGHAWRRRRGSAACVCLAMGGTCAISVSVLWGRVGGGRSEAWTHNMCHNVLVPKGEGGTGFGLIFDEPTFPHLGKSHNLSEPYPHFPHLLVEPKIPFSGGPVRGVLSILLVFGRQSIPASFHSPGRRGGYSHSVGERIAETQA